MRQRTSILLPLGQGVDPKSISLQDASLTVRKQDATIEERATWGLDELPHELSTVLRQSHELHIHWTQAQAYHHMQPLLSRLPPGLHTSYTPLDATQDDQLCLTLRKLFSPALKCKSLASSFSRPPVLSERFAQTASFQHYQLLTSLSRLAQYVDREVCTGLAGQKLQQACQHYAQSLPNALAIDADYDAISHALTVTATWNVIDFDKASSNDEIKIEQLVTDDRVEIGVLAPEEPEEPEELKLGGFLAVLGENEKPSATLFSFPSRHHPLPAKDATVFNVSFSQPTGLHPTMQVDFPRKQLQPPRESCRLHAYLTLPSALFIDRYQLSDPSLLVENNLRALHALSGAEDLEAPDWAVQQWGSASLFELVTPSSKDNDNSGLWRASIPLHLRYLQATANSTSSYRELEVPWPIAFWACEAEEGLKMATNPFDRVNLGYDGLFGPKTMFYHIPPAQDRLMSDLTVPVLQPENASWVQVITMITVLAGFSWVLLSLFMPLKKSPQNHAKRE